MRFARAGESLTALNGKTYALKPDYLVLADGQAVESLAGVMGGAASGVSASTHSVFLEVALFKPGAVAATGRDLQLSSDARYRFERGLDPEFVFDAAELAGRMILDLCGGEASEIVSAGTVPEWRRHLSLRDSRVETLGGVSIPQERQMQLLRGIGCTVEGTDIIPPSWRPDIEGEADLVEEILRLNGYDAIPAVPLPRDTVITKPAISAAQKRVLLAKRILAKRGFNEAVTFSFLASAKTKVDASLILKNPISAELDAMRPSLLPNLLEAAERNAARGFGDAALFEVGPIFTTEATNNGQRTVAGFIRTGEALPKAWNEPARAVDAYDAKADALALLSELGVNLDSVAIEAKPTHMYHPYRAGIVRLGNKVLAEFGELHPEFERGRKGDWRGDFPRCLARAEKERHRETAARACRLPAGDARLCLCRCRNR